MDNEHRYYDDEIELRDLIRPLWRRRWLITGIFVLAVFVAGIWSYMMAPVYQVHALISLGKFNSSIYTSTGPAREVIVSDDFIREVAEELNLGIPNEQFRAFKDSIKVEAVSDANMLKISIETTDRAEGKAVLEQIFRAFYDKSYPEFEREEKLLRKQLATLQAALEDVEGRIATTAASLERIESGRLDTIERDFRRSQLLESAQGFEEQRLALLDRALDLQKELNGLQTAKVIRSPREPITPVKPNKKMNVALAGVLGLMVGVFLAFGLEYARNNPLNLDED